MPNFKFLISKSSSSCEPVGTESKVQSGLRNYEKKREREREWEEREKGIEDIGKMKKIILRKKELNQRQNINASQYLVAHSTDHR